MRLGLALLAGIVLTGTACGKYGPPQRALEPTPAPASAPAPAPASAPAPAPDAPDDAPRDR